MLYFKTEGERIGVLVEKHGPTYPEIEQRIDRMEAVGRVELTLLFLIVVDMVVKPTGNDVGLLIAGAAILVAAAALAFFRLRPEAPQPT